MNLNRDKSKELSERLIKMEFHALRLAREKKKASEAHQKALQIRNKANST